MISPSTLLFLLIAACSVILLSAQPLNDQDDANCPVGFWCRRKRSYESNCPLGFWCKRSANDEGKEDDDAKCVTRGIFCKRKDKVIERATTQGDCPMGFWCKRDAVCPVGFWCRKKRSADSRGCPVGFWCKKSTMGPAEKRSINLEGYGCPNGMWCRRSEYVVDEDTPEENCPKRYWCRKSVINTKQVSHRRIPQNSMGRPKPPKRPQVSSDNFNWECPMGFWC